MKITKSQLKQIILEELSSLETGEQRRDFQKMMDAPAQQQITFEEWIAAVSELGYEFGEASPNPYDAWLEGQSPEEYSEQISEEKAKNNPWAICTASVGRENKEKYEKCVLDVKKKME